MNWWMTTIFIYIARVSRSYCYIVIYSIITTIIKTEHAERRSNKRRRKTSLTIFLPLTLFVRFEKVVWGFTVRGSWRSNITAIFWPPLLWPSRCVFLVLLMLNRRPRAHCWMLAFFIASYQHLLWTPNSIRVSEGPLGRVWLSLPHLVSSCLELYWQLLWLVELNWII